MSPQEVDGLQALAMRHGGSLTINPQTGLPEAGFLSSILPLIAGIGLTAMGMPAGMAALTVGGGTALVTGDLKKGLMAGLGAYGGAGLAESLIGSGAAGLVPEVAAASLNAVPTETAAQIASSAAPQAANIASEYTRISPPDMFASGPPGTYQSAIQAAGPIQAAEAVKAAAPQTVTPQPEMYTKGAYLPNSAATMSPANMTAGQRFDALKAGATGQNLLNYAKANPLQTAGMLAGPLMASEDNNAPFTSIGDADRGAMANAGYQFDPGWSNPIPAADPYGREQRYNQPRYYIPKKAADGGAVQHFDVGGTVNGFNQTPALNKFAELQAARGATPAPATIDAKQQFADYLRAQSRPVSTATPYHPVVESHLPVSSGGGGNLGGGGGGGGIGRIGTSAGFGSGSGNVSSGFVGSGAAAGSSISPDAGANNNINPGWGSRDAGGGTPSAANPMELDPAQRAQASLVDMTSNSLTNNPAVGEGGETGYINSLTENPAVGEGGETVQSGYTNSLTENPAVGEGGETIGEGSIKALQKNQVAAVLGDSGFYTGDAGDGMDNVDTSNPEIFSQEYVDPRADPFEAAERLEQSEMNEGYFGGFDNGSGSDSDSGGNFGSGFDSGGGCPAPWINITLSDGGTVKAGDIKPGMMVYTRHETTGEWGNFPVTVVRNGEDNRWTILFESGIEFVGTFNHPVRVDDAWVEIQHLKAGDKVVQPEGFAVVKSAKYFDHGPIVKIEVQDAHTYLTEGFLSHNKNMVDYSFGGDYGGIGGGGDYGYDMSYRAKGGPIKSNFKNARNINAYRSGLTNYAGGGIAALAQGGMYNLGSYSDGGRLLRGPGDGVSDSIPAVIGRKQPARLADGEFVIPARIVSEIGNGSTEAGARKLYAMMDKVQSARRATVGKGRVAKNTRADRYLPA
jgi:hypothetical protein